MWLVEVFNVVYRGYIELKPDQLIGTTKVNDGVHDHYLYKVSKVEKSKPSIKRLDEVVLSGPSIGSISGKGSVTFDVDLFCGAYKDSFTVFKRRPGKSISTAWPTEKKIVSKDGRGEICVLYAIFDDAVEAHIKIKFFTKGHFEPEAYGVIAASTSEIDTLEYSTMLCIKKQCEKVKVKSGKPFPLSRSIVAVPLGSVFFVDMHLMIADKNLVEETFEFHPKKSGTDMKPFEGNKFRGEVQVTWESA